MKAVWTMAGLVMLGIAVALAVSPWTLRGAARRAEITQRMSQETGLDIRAAGRMSIKLLPRPRVRIADLSVAAPDGSLSLVAPAFSGDLDVLALMRGQWRLVSTTVSSPTATIDLDATQHPFRGQASEAKAFRLSIRSGVFRLISRKIGIDSLLTDVTATTDQTAGTDAGFSANGTAVWRNLPGQFTLRIGATTRETAEPQSSAFLQISSPIASFGAVGDISGGAQPQFAGRIFASTRAPARLLPMFGLGPFRIALDRASLSGDALARMGDISVSGADLRLNADSFEGTLGYHADNGHGLIEGTLATGRLDLDSLAGRDIDGAAMAAFYRTRLAPHLADVNLDLRISAGQIVAGGTTIEDAALSLLSRDRRMEVTLDEAQAFGGLVKARLLALLEPDGIKAHAEMALTAIELGPLGIAMSDQERMTGTLTGKVTLDGHGESLSDIVPTLAGDGQVSVENGHVMGVSVSQALKRFTRRLPFGADQPGQLTSFALASSEMTITDGTVTFIDGKVSGPGIAMAFGGHGDLPRGKVDILAVASQTDAAGSVITGTPGLPLEMRGAWGSSLTVIEQAHHLALPKIFLPNAESGQILP